MWKAKEKMEALENDVREVREELFKHVVILNNNIIELEARFNARDSFFRDVLAEEEAEEVGDAAETNREFFVKDLGNVPAFALRVLLGGNREIRESYLNFITKLARYEGLLEQYINEDYTPFYADDFRQAMERVHFALDAVAAEWERRGLSEEDFK